MKIRRGILLQPSVGFAPRWSLHAAASARGKVLIVRAGDFFGPSAANNWFTQALVTPGRAVLKITQPGMPGVGHQWAYLPDVAETMVRLLEKRDELEPFAVFHMKGHWDGDGTQLINAIRWSVGNPGIKVRFLPSQLMRLASPFVPLFRALVEMRYLWTTPVRMGNERLTAILGAEPHTSLDTAVRNTLIGLDCLPPSLIRSGSERARRDFSSCRDGVERT